MHGGALKIAVVGSGISGLSAAWLLNQRHDVVLYEQDGRLGGHSNTVLFGQGDDAVAVDTGFIVYNEATYPNLTALFRHIGVETQPSDMSFAVSIAGGDLEYSGANLAGLFAQKRNLFRPRFWSMLHDLQRFYREAPAQVTALDQMQTTLSDFLAAGRYGAAFRDDHLLPMAGAIWSASPQAILNYPAASFLRFQDNHGLLRWRNRPQWRTVSGGSRRYVDVLARGLPTRRGARAVSVGDDGNVEIIDAQGQRDRFDHVVIATHADQAVRLLAEPTATERSLLGAFKYARNSVHLHDDPSLMPRRRGVWSSWNYLGDDRMGVEQGPTVTYWMNLLQGIRSERPLFVTLNPARTPRETFYAVEYDHPLFDDRAMSVQRQLWSLQGKRNIWFCGSYFGSGFHEDGLQAGLAVAEAIGGVMRPWQLENPSSRIVVGERPSVSLGVSA
ncbi:protoporphyrinogen oxidase [Variibacter gotjawalensis]|uniref:Protoporphyrinogen oxidase n=1 Tax=Variibacter gotjawalensis TaxID=1333996 RepID=A0A0S3Q087_9BRAD|nr:FAD-dependent oxidoreductase [Variibacter gotjawalensis]NIK47446.1 hypothetical protein [Variibacter gotjawalensis]RZS49341.1 hypothetical protein EV661_1771 [Variibacter gotjawalensis]BAT61605.1 protoporphyrinogen oxidase [Variibacter gotjawalensis]